MAAKQKGMGIIKLSDVEVIVYHEYLDVSMLNCYLGTGLPSFFVRPKSPSLNRPWLWLPLF
jgi:hypothetical protein